MSKEEHRKQQRRLKKRREEKRRRKKAKTESHNQGITEHTAYLKSKNDEFIKSGGRSEKDNTGKGEVE